MSIQQPPLALAIRLEQRWIPGIWGWFYERANRALRTAPPRTLNSWYRTPLGNRQVQGAVRSQHLVGLALDISPDPGVVEAFQAAGFQVIDFGTHIHIQAYPAGILPGALFRDLGVG